MHNVICDCSYQFNDVNATFMFLCKIWSHFNFSSHIYRAGVISFPGRRSFEDMHWQRTVRVDYKRRDLRAHLEWSPLTWLRLFSLCSRCGFMALSSCLWFCPQVSTAAVLRALAQQCNRKKLKISTCAIFSTDFEKNIYNICTVEYTKLFRILLEGLKKMDCDWKRVDMSLMFHVVLVEYFQSCCSRWHWWLFSVHLLYPQPCLSFVFLYSMWITMLLMCNSWHSIMHTDRKLSTGFEQLFLPQWHRYVVFHNYCKQLIDQALRAGICL